MLRAQVLYHVTLSASEGSRFFAEFTLSRMRFFASLRMTEELLNNVKSRGAEVGPKS